MPFYLSELIGAGTRADPFRPVGFDVPGCTMIDLRADASRQDGGGLNAALVRTTVAFSDARARLLGDDKLDTLPVGLRNQLSSRLGVDLSSPTLLRDVIATLLTSPAPGGWKALKPGRLRWEIWLGELIWSVPAAAGGSSAADNFNRANETPLAAPWTKVIGASSFNLATNRVTWGTEEDHVYYYAGSTSTADQYAEARIVDATGEIGPATRVNSTGPDAYVISSSLLYKIVGGTWTSVGDFNFALVNVSDVLRLESEGSTHRGYNNGVAGSNPSFTDTSIAAAGNGAGMEGFTLGSGLDDWAGGDLAVAEKQTAYFARSRAVGRR